MSIIDLNRAFPKAADGSQGPLPKQKLLLDLALKPGTPKYIRYVGGIGSGKTLIGCITVLCWALMYPGDYLVARQFLPELKLTTLKTFLECINAVGSEIILEYRVADCEIKIRSRGGVSNIIFRGLDEPDKHRSLNLNGFYIDEANQVSEAAFLLLQGRLRGKYVRKGILTQNTGGHDWTYRYFVKQDHFSSEEIKKEFVNIKAPSTENFHLPEGYVETILQSWSEDRIRREIYADEDSFAGQVYNEFRSDIHVVPPFAIPKEWTKVVGVDHGYRNPAAWIWGAVDYDGNVYIYREFYQKEWIIEEIVKGKDIPGKGHAPGVLELMKDPTTGKLEHIQAAYIDPSTRASRGTMKNGRVYSDYDEYVEYLPKDFPLVLANNEKTVGIDKVKNYLKVNPRTNKPRLFVFNTCKNLLDEVATYRYEELPTGQVGKKNDKEEPMKVKDHAMDAWRYLIMAMPDPPKPEEEVWEKLKYNSIEGQLYRELQDFKKLKQKDPFGNM